MLPEIDGILPEIGKGYCLRLVKDVLASETLSGVMQSRFCYIYLFILFLFIYLFYFYLFIYFIFIYLFILFLFIYLLIYSFIWYVGPLFPPGILIM